MIKPKTKKPKKKKKLKPELMDIINNLIKTLKDPRDKAKIQSLIKGNKSKDVLFEMKQILRNFNPYHRQGSSYVVSSEAPPVKKPRIKKVKPETISPWGNPWYNPDVEVKAEARQNTPMSQARSTVLPARANMYDSNVSAINQEVIKNLVQTEIEKVKQEVTRLGAHLLDQNVSALRQFQQEQHQPPPLEAPEDKPEDEEEEEAKPRSLFFQASSGIPPPDNLFHREEKSSSSSSSTKKSSRLSVDNPKFSNTRSSASFGASPPAHNTRSRAKP